MYLLWPQKTCLSHPLYCCCVKYGSHHFTLALLTTHCKPKLKSRYAKWSPAWYLCKCKEMLEVSPWIWTLHFSPFKVLRLPWRHGHEYWSYGYLFFQYYSKGEDLVSIEFSGLIYIGVPVIMRPEIKYEPPKTVQRLLGIYIYITIQLLASLAFIDSIGN